MSSDFLILAIESSCDETAVAILRPPGTILCSLIASQAEEHARFGGVVPEVASRNHLLAVDPLVRRALSEAGITPGDLGAVAATSGPGLAPALLVGASYAKGFAMALGIPYLALNHLEGHLLSPFLGAEEIPPHLALLVSGGHTQLTLVRGVGDYTVLGRTLDDAAGEAFDKIAKLLGLPYPGGIEIDRLAATGNPKAHEFPQALPERENLDFSFSGLKTSVRYFLEKNPELPKSSQGMADLCASVRHAIVGVLLRKTEHAVEAAGVKRVALSGGVAANRALREGMTRLCQTRGWALHLPAPELATDNAAMMAFAAVHHLAAGERSPIAREISPQWQVGNGKEG
ncbi:MAG: tRNA (adenosine(37)-N6)-threonylcarbamoyltransferase complex transferase subunit TsaD [Chthoniobacterales bacterium]